MILSAAVRMSDPSQVVEARRLATDQARWLQWDEESSARAGLLATELATNLVKHAQDGVLAVNASAQLGAGSSLQLVAVDQGPGMANVEQCLQDGYSTAGSPGTGLGAIRRLACGLDIFSTPGKGTVMYAELRPVAAHGASAGKRFITGAVCIPRHGETVNGDAWVCDERDGKFFVLACDGLGHGPSAAEASHKALLAFQSRFELGAKETLIRLHESMRPTRGAAAALAIIDPAQGKVTYCGIGNITGALVTGSTLHHLVSHNGILGHSMARTAEFTYLWTDDSTLVLHSDGLSTRWRQDQWPGLWLRAPALIAGVLYRDCSRGRDDSMAVIVRCS